MKKAQNHTETVLLTINDVEIEAEAQFTYQPGYPARTCGAPEYCYPEEQDEICINALTADDTDLTHVLLFEAVEETLLIQLQDIINTAKLDNTP